MAGSKLCRFFHCGKAQDDAETAAQFAAPALAGNAVTAVASGQTAVEAPPRKGAQAKATAPAKYEIPGTVVAEEELQVRSLVKAGLLDPAVAAAQLRAAASAQFQKETLAFQTDVDRVLARIRHDSLAGAGLIGSTETPGAGVVPRG